MKRAIRAALLISVLLFAASLATCHFGVKNEIAKLPPDHPAHRGDTDWIGMEWIERAMVMQAIALALLATATVIWGANRKRAGVKSVPR